MAPLKLADDRMCIGCGEKNPRGLKLSFEVDEKQRRIRTRWTPTKEFQGYADLVHGGMIGLVLDELMGNLLWKIGHPSVSAELRIRFRRPARVEEPIECEAWIASEDSTRSRKRFTLEAAAYGTGRRLLTEASGLYVEIRD